MLNTDILNRILKRRNYFYCIAVSALFGIISVKMPMIAIIIGLSSIVIFVLKSKYFRNFYLTSTKWQIAYYLIIIYASIFPLISRYYSLPIDYGVMKVLLLSVLFFVYILSIFLGKKFFSSRAILSFGLIYLSFIVFFLLLLAQNISNDSVSISEGLNLFMGYAYYPIIVFFAYNEFKSERQTKNLFSLVLIISIFMCIVGLIEWVVGPVALSSTGMKVLTPGWSLSPSLINPYVRSVEEIDIFRVFSTLTDHQAYAAFLLLSVFTILYFIFTSRNRLKYYFLLAFVFCSTMITYSLTAIGGAILFCLFCFAGIFFITKYKRHLRNLLLLIFAMVIVYLVGIHLKFNERIVTGGIVVMTDRTSGRLYLFLNGIKAFLNNPLGYGFSAKKMGLLGTSSDCYWLWTLLQLGLPLFVIYFLIYFYPIVAVFKVVRRRKSTQNIQLPWLIFSLFIVNIFFLNFSNNLMMTGPSNLIFWAIVGASLNKNLFELA